MQQRRFGGTFNLHGRSVAGELSLRGPNTSLSLHHPECLAPAAAGASIHGTTHTGEHLTLIDCQSTEFGSTHTSGGITVYHADVFPHYVAIGRGPFNPHEPCVLAVHFTSTDLATLFYDFDAFGHVIDAKAIIDTVLEERREMRPVESGAEPLVSYFTGRTLIADVGTAIGRLSVRHSPRFNPGGPRGVYIKNQIVMSIEPERSVTFENAMDRLRHIVSFLSMAAGRGQGIRLIQITTTAGTPQTPSFFAIHPSHPWKASTGNTRHKLHPADLPLNPIDHSVEFNTVLIDWIRRDERWRMARVRYLDCLRRGNYYDANRLIAAANMFDLLPPEAIPMPTQLPAELAATKAACEAMFLKHPRSIDRDSALSALGRLGKPSLPKKAAHRVAMVESKLATRFPDLHFVTSVAIRCRNFLVHGTDEINYPALEPLVPFLTDTLEFVFAASDFIEAGWDAQRWDSHVHSWGHGFARFRWHYAALLTRLRSATAKTEARHPSPP